MTNNDFISIEFLNMLNYPVYCINNHSELIMINKAFLAFLNIENEELVINKNVKELIDTSELEFSRNSEIKIISVYINEVYKHLKISKSFINDDLMIISILETDYNLEAENRRDYMAKLSREIRIPLNTIVGLTELSKKSTDINEVYENMIKISNSSSDLIELINSLFDIDSLQNNKLILTKEPVDMQVLTDTLHEIFNDRCKEKHITFNIENKVNDITVIGDYNRIQKILINLISNSIKFNHEFGEVNVLIETGERQDKNVQLIIKVKDDGRGFSDDFKERIFEPYSQENELSLSNRGIGLGLTVVKYLVELMEGNISFNSEVNQGSEFIINILMPYIDLISNNDFSDLNVLIIDDDVKSCQYISMILDHMNIKNEYLSSSIDALDLISKNYYSYNLYIVDYTLPYVDGITLSRQINSNNHDAKIILMSNYDSDHFNNELQKIYNYYLLQKPLNKSTLYNALIQSFGDEVLKKLLSESKQNYDFTGNRILVVEDFEMNAEILMKLLEKVHIECDWAKDGNQALSIIEEKGDYYYDMVFMDIMMENLDGYQTTLKIRELGKDYTDRLPIYAMTAESFKEDKEKCMEVGMNGHLPKPINVKLLYNILDTVLSRKGE